MPSFSQAARMMAVSTPLGTDILLLEGFTGVEELSSLFVFRLELLADSQTTIPFEKLLGQAVTVTLPLPDGSQRYLNGIVRRFSQGSQVWAGQTSLTRYQAEVVPQLWLLGRTVRSRTFQQQSVPDILQTVLAGLDVAYQLEGQFEPREYCVQYRESDLDFVSRLLEEEGIYYFFNHQDGSHQLVLANTPPSHPVVTGPSAVPYDAMAGGNRPEDRVAAWVKTQELRSVQYSLWDHCFEMPEKNLDADKPTLDSVRAGTVTHQLDLGGSGLEIQDYPGGYAKRYDGISSGGGDQASQLEKVFDDGVRTVGIRMQQETLPALRIDGRSSCRQFSAGHRFTLQGYQGADGDYVLTRVEHRGSLVGTYGTSPIGPDFYENSFQCIPADLPYRPAKKYPPPRIEGPQTAVVVGPSGQEIFTDKYGRVKVQFFWDRLGQKNASSSCWVRVATPWAGQQWGAVHIPRIGQEVVVQFLEGDPDRPLILGSVYNAAQMPPYLLPDNSTQSGVKSRSTQQGELTQFNELRFEDKKGSEEVYFHAEKDFTRVVENNDVLQVGYEELDGQHKSADGSQTIKIYKDRTETLETGDETVTIAKGSRTHSVKKDDTLTVQGKQTATITGDQTVTITDGNRTHSVKKNDTLTVQGKQTTTITGDQALTISDGNRTATVKKNDTLTVDGKQTVTITGEQTVTISSGSQTVKVSSGSSKTQAGLSIQLSVGSNSITINQSGITIKGTMVTIQGSATVEAKSPMTTVSGSGMLTLKGGVTMIN